MQAPEPPDEDSAVSIAVPLRNVFDAIARGVQQDGSGRLARLASTYDPLLTPEQNLPGGKLTAGQRYFVENVWQPLVKPRLAAGGFWPIANIA
jgi:hypothetical protein